MNTTPRLECRALTKATAVGRERAHDPRRRRPRDPTGRVRRDPRPSGSGKSTLLGLLAGLDRPSSGSVLFDGERIDDRSEDQLSLWRAAMSVFVFQSFQLLANLTALENVLLPLELAGIAAARERAKRALGPGRPRRARAPLPRATLGRRATARRAGAPFAPRPSVLFADEPTAISTLRPARACSSCSPICASARARRS